MTKREKQRLPRETNWSLSLSWSSFSNMWASTMWVSLVFLRISNSLCGYLKLAVLPEAVCRESQFLNPKKKQKKPPPVWRLSVGSRSPFHMCCWLRMQRKKVKKVKRKDFHSNLLIYDKRRFLETQCSWLQETPNTLWQIAIVQYLLLIDLKYLPYFSKEPMTRPS